MSDEFSTSASYRRWARCSMSLTPRWAESDLSGKCEERLPIVSIEELAGPDHQESEGCS